MELAPTTRLAAGAQPATGETPRAVLWHDLECGSYEADLPLWRELAGALAPGEQILEIGAGTGRVSLELARHGHAVTALENDPRLLGELRERARDLPVTPVLADAHGFELERRDFALCLVPMQTLQLFGGERGRAAFFASARAHLRPRGLLACAVVTHLDSFDCAADGTTPTPEIARVGCGLYCSEVVSVRSGRRGTRIERRRIVAAAADAAGPAQRTSERYVVELDPVDAVSLEREARAAGLNPAEQLMIPSTEDYAGSLVLSFHA